MLSRVADSLYWMSRYLERAEHTARVINVQLDLMLEHGSDPDDRMWARTLHSLGIESAEPDREHTVAHLLIRETSSRSSIVACVMAARENARQVREQISSEMWEQLNRLFHEVKRAGPGEVADARDFLAAIKEGAHLFQGVTDSTMTHGEGWQFIQVGRFLERAVLVSALVGVHFREFQGSLRAPAAEYLEWIGLLRSCTAFEAYCKAYTADLQPLRIAEFLVLHLQLSAFHPFFGRCAGDRAQANRRGGFRAPLLARGADRGAAARHPRFRPDRRDRERRLARLSR